MVNFQTSFKPQLPPLAQDLGTSPQATREMGVPKTVLPSTREVFPGLPAASTKGTRYSDARMKPASTPLEQMDAFDAPRIAPAELAEKGFVANTLKVQLSGNMHFQDWFEKVDRDASVVVAVGSAYAGLTVKVGREVFQDAAQNYYRTFHDRFSPMVFLDVDHHWSTRFPVAPLLRELFGPERFATHITLTTEVSGVLAALGRRALSEEGLTPIHPGTGTPCSDPANN